MNANRVPNDAKCGRLKQYGMTTKLYVEINKYNRKYAIALPSTTLLAP